MKHPSKPNLIALGAEAFDSTPTSRAAILTLDDAEVSSSGGGQHEILLNPCGISGTHSEVVHMMRPWPGVRCVWNSWWNISN